MGRTAIDAPRKDLFMVNPEDLVLITNPKHPLFDKRVKLPIDEAKVENVAEFGVHTPVDVVKEIVAADCLPAEGCAAGEEVLVVVKGRQRVKWARAANLLLKAAGKELLRVPVQVKKLEVGVAFGIMMGENSCREEEGMLAKADKAARYIELGHTEEEAARAAGVTPQAVKQWLACIKLTTKIRKAIEAGAIAPSAAAKLAELPSDEQDLAYDELAKEGGKITGKKAKAKAGGKKGKKAEGGAPGKKRLKKVVGYLESNKVGEQIMYVLAWAMGDMDDDDIMDKVPMMQKALTSIRQG